MGIVTQPLPTYRRRLKGVAEDNYGYVTTAMAAAVGVPPVELRKLIRHGGVHNVAYGLYRFDDVMDGELDQCKEAVLRVGAGAFLWGDAVLALHGLALVAPRRIRVGTPRRARATLPPYVAVKTARVPEKDLTAYFGIPSTTVARAILDCKGIVMRERLEEAAEEARVEGLVGKREADELCLMIRLAA